MTQAVQIVLTDDSVARLAGAAAYTAEALGLTDETESGDAEESEALRMLQAFLEQVYAHPSQFPVTGAMAVSVRKAAKLKGPAQPSRKNKRKARQAGRRAWQRVQRKNRREQAEQYNEGRERMEKELAEIEAMHAQDEARIEQILAQDNLSSADLTELFRLMGVAPLADKVEELRQAELAAPLIDDKGYLPSETQLVVPHYSTKDEA